MASPEVEELTDGQPEAIVVENARRKAASVPGERVLGVDTVVSVDAAAYGKPRDAAEARDSLERLSGRWHEVWSGISLRSGGREATVAERTRVLFRDLSGAEIDWYLSTDEWRERAGAYAIQGRGAALVERIDGDFWNVVGLPVPALIGLAPDLLVSPG